MYDILFGDGDGHGHGGFWNVVPPVPSAWHMRRSAASHGWGRFCSGLRALLAPCSLSLLLIKKIVRLGVSVIVVVLRAGGARTG